jgi:hypothetical protein
MESRAIPLPTLWDTPGLQRVILLYSSSNIIRVMMSIGSMQAGIVACGVYGGEERCIEDFGGES